MRSFRVKNVIRPVRVKNISVVVEVAVISRDAISAVENCEEVGQQVDEHQQPDRRWGRKRSALFGCEKIPWKENSNKCDLLFVWHRNSPRALRTMMG
jgi:hypothetical protein